ncbi:MAG: MlaD family protein [Bdellovibrionaceae bacterium]|nr:MlaD family protein [Pseudobdellovibrionaceae bacterium]
MKVETKVGLLFLTAIALVAAFAYYLGVLNPFSNSHELQLAYNFAGGIEVGSPVRVMGIKVGKVTSIKFDPGMRTPEGEEVKLRVTVSIQKDAWKTVRGDSKFFINLAGVIGEKFIEVTPGSAVAPELQPGVLVRGEDPPRIDQLISQSYGLAGKILDMVERNEGSVTDTIEKISALVTNLNKTLVLLDKMANKPEFAKVVGNVSQISEDLVILTSRLRGPEAQKTLDLVHRLVWRLDKLDDKAIREFLQKEGIRARLF